MADDNSRFDRVAQSMTRRRALAGGATLLTAGGTLVWVSDPASAQVTIAEFTAESRQFDAEQVAPVVEATLAWDYDVGNRVVSAIRLRLTVDGTAVAEDTLTTDRTTLNGETTLSGSVVDSEAWSAADFAPDVAASVTRSLTVGIELAVLDDRGEAIVSDRATDTAELTVSHPQDSEYTAEIGGAATFHTPE